MVSGPLSVLMDVPKVRGETMVRKVCVRERARECGSDWTLIPCLPRCVMFAGLPIGPTESIRVRAAGPIDDLKWPHSQLQSTRLHALVTVDVQ